MGAIAKATKRPWRKQRLGGELCVAPVDGGFIADLQLSDCVDDEDRERCEADADLIVLAANAYDDLLAACKLLVYRCKCRADEGGIRPEDLAEAQTAIAKAEPTTK